MGCPVLVASPGRALTKPPEAAGRGQRGGTLTVTVVLVVHGNVVAPGVGSTFDPFVIELSFPI